MDSEQLNYKFSPASHAGGEGLSGATVREI